MGGKRAGRVMSDMPRRFWAPRPHSSRDRRKKSAAPDGGVYFLPRPRPLPDMVWVLCKAYDLSMIDASASTTASTPSTVHPNFRLAVVYVFSLQQLEERHSSDARTSTFHRPTTVQRCAQLQRRSLRSYLAVVVVVLTASAAVSCRHLSHLVLVLLLEAPADGT